MQFFTLGSFVDVKVIENKIFSDDRGFFLESYNKRNFQYDLKINEDFVQDNHSKSQKGVIRGLHFQKKPFAQSKLVRVTRGSILDVVVDLRKNSITFGQWESLVLSEKNSLMLFIPEGFAHGFLATEDNTDVLYKTNNFYNPDCDVTLLWNDTNLNINWKLNHYNISNPIISKKDKSAYSLKELEQKKQLFF
ncbi:MAG: dTDP-4-dehydrorhamnose 3,5-epimerase [Betaproteobacteria bacterium TMED156]|nr:MAG: dTDP-4-dehydrorhamnose 3,5-epimerase [Betaproteobacteria bacterium TMED156]